jgi:hypothetical protein
MHDMVLDTGDVAADDLDSEPHMDVCICSRITWVDVGQIEE